MPRHVTDAPCLVLHLGFLAGLGYIFAIARREGNLAKLTHGIDWRGQICGVDQEVADRPLLYWCDPGGATELSLEDGTCVSRCPVDTSSSNWCPGEARPFQYRERNRAGGRKEVVVGAAGEAQLVARNVSLRRDYASTEVLGYCFPTRNVALLHKIVERAHASGTVKRLLLAAHGAAESWRFLLGVAAGCVALGYLFLLLLWLCFDKLVYVLGLALHALLLLAVAAFAYAGFHDRYNVFRRSFDDSTARLCTFASSAAALIVWVLYLVLCLYSKSAVRSTIDSVSATCSVIGQLPTLLLQPLIDSALRVAALAPLLYGFAWVLSMGEVVPIGSPMAQAGVEVAGMHRRLDFDARQWLCVLYWAFGILWVAEVVSALGRFAISYAVVSFTSFNAKQAFPLLQGYCMGLGFHLGTLAFAGLVLSLLKLVAAVCTFLARQARDDQSVQGSVTRVACCCCAYGALCAERLVSMVNDLVYTDVALQGTGYLEAAENVVRVTASNPVEYALLKASAAAVWVLGVLTVGGGGALMARACLASGALHRQAQQALGGASGALTTSSVNGTTAAAALICLHIAMAFMAVFHQTTHSLTYCMLMGAATVGDASPSSARKRLPLMARDLA